MGSVRERVKGGAPEGNRERTRLQAYVRGWVAGSHLAWNLYPRNCDAWCLRPCMQAVAQRPLNGQCGSLDAFTTPRSQPQGICAKETRPCPADADRGLEGWR